MSKEKFTLTVFSENSPGILHRMSVMFTRRQLNIESLTVCQSEKKGISRFTIVIKCEEDLAQKVVKQINRIVEVKEIYYNRNSELIFKEIAFYKVETSDKKQRIELEELAEKYDAHVIYIGDTYLIIEKTGAEDEIMSLFKLLDSYGIKEFTRSGRIALRKEENLD